MNIFLDLFLTFAKIGLFTFGSGYAMVPIIEDNCVEQKKWITHDEMMNVTIIAESTPGPIAINCATFTGYKQGGFLGALAATFGVVLPSFVVIYLISIFFENILEIEMIANAFKGIKIAVGILITNAGIRMMKRMDKGKLSGAIMICSCAIMLLNDFFVWNISSITLMLIAASVSLIALVSKTVSEQKGGGDQ